MLNIPSFAGGLDLWKSACGKLGLVGAERDAPVRFAAMKELDWETIDSRDVDLPMEAKSEAYLRVVLEGLQKAIDSEKGIPKELDKWQSLVVDSLDEDSQRVGDGRLEMITFKSLVELSLSNLQRVIPPQLAPAGGWRICQAADHVRLVFAPMKKTEKVYFQVDGEFYIGYKLKDMTIRHASRIPVLVHPKYTLMK